MRRSQSFPAELASVSAARHFARAALESLPGTTRDAVELMVSELTTNSVKHAATTFELIIDCAATYVRVEVTDTGAGEPVARDPAPSEPSGRGLRIVEVMSDKWGIKRSGDATTVWFLLHAESSGEHAASPAGAA